MRNRVNKLKCNLYVIIFKSNTPLGKIFDISLLVIILINLALVMLDSLEGVHEKYGDLLYAIEWVITGLFLMEYIIRIWVVNKKVKYIFSFYGIVDILAILPSFISLFVVGTHFLAVIRTLRLLRIFSIFQMRNYTQQSNVLIRSLISSWSKISVFLLTVITAITVIGTLMYLIEGPGNGFTNIPISIYWTIVTITTVGYGDISPVTPIGQFIASVTMIIGYSIIAVPTGIITAEAIKQRPGTKKCSRCFSDNGNDYNYCKKCGLQINILEKKE